MRGQRRACSSEPRSGGGSLGVSSGITYVFGGNVILKAVLDRAITQPGDSC